MKHWKEVRDKLEKELALSLKSVDEYDYSQDAVDMLIGSVKAEGYKVIETKPNLILLDLDGEASQFDWEYKMNEVFNLLGLTAKSVGDWESLGGIGRHAVIKINVGLKPMERIAIQIALGSDLRREIHSIRRIWAGTKPFSMLIGEHEAPK
jgi:hypothetical protein